MLDCPLDSNGAGVFYDAGLRLNPEGELIESYG